MSAFAALLKVYLSCLRISIQQCDDHGEHLPSCPVMRERLTGGRLNKNIPTDF